MSQRNRLTFCVVGDDALAIRCVSALQATQGEIIQLVSGGVLFSEWATGQQDVLPVALLDILSKKIAICACDYVIIASRNQRHIQPLLALNTMPCLVYFEADVPHYYHRTPIPEAIMQKAKNYQITWACFDERRAMFILEQARIELAIAETAGNVVRKCLPVATETLLNVVNFLAKNDMPKHLKAANILHKKSIFYDGIIDWHRPADQIERFSRALDFAQYENAWARCKILLSHEFVAFDRCNITEQESEAPPGTIVAIERDSIFVTTGTQVVRIVKPKYPDGSLLCEREIAQLFELGAQLLPVEVAKQRAISEQLWRAGITELSAIQRLLLPITVNPYFSASKKMDVLPASEQLCLGAELAHTVHAEPKIVYFALIIAYLARLVGDAELSFFHGSLRVKMDCLFFNGSPEAVALEDVSNFDSLIQLCQRVFNRPSPKIAKDILLRYPWLIHAGVSWLPENAPLQFYALKKDDVFSGVQADGLTFIYHEERQACEIRYSSGDAVQEEKQLFCQQICTHIKYIYQQIVQNKALLLAELSVLTPKAMNQLLNEWGGEKKPIPKKLTIEAALSSALRKYNHQVAIVEGDEKITYAQLAEQTDNVAGWLQHKKQGVGSCIGIVGKRGIKTIIAIIGVLKAGCTYVPIDEKQPEKRMQYMLNNADVSLLINTSDLVIQSDCEEVALSVCFHKRWLPKKSKATDGAVAYIIHTSGSTGMPQGVRIHRHALRSFIHWHLDFFPVLPETRSSVIFSIGFDFSVAEIFPFLLGGATLFVVPLDLEKKSAVFVEWIKKNRLNHLSLPTALVNRLLQERNLSFSWPIVLSAGGERLESVQRLSENIDLYNHYGQTETTVFVTQKKIIGKTISRESPSIGRPIDNTKLFILNKQKKILPIGCCGEIVVSGESLGLGYIDPVRTDEKFVAIWLNNEKYWCYLSGDRGRWLPNGEMAYVARMDKQIKIRGYRVELGEIEETLLKHHAVAEAAVIAKPVESTHILFAYIATNTDSNSIDTAEIKAFLSERLPNYMLPMAIMVMNKLPVNINQKIDKKQLLSLVDKKVDNQSSGKVGAVSIIIKIVESLLKIKALSITSKTHLFELGIDSILASLIVQRSSLMLGKQIPLKLIYQYPIVSELAVAIEQLKQEKHTFFLSTRRAISAPLSYSQKSLWEFYRLNKGDSSYNVSVIWRFPGDLDVRKMQKACDELLRKQPSLTTAFACQDGDVLQTIKSHAMTLVQKKSKSEEQSKQQIKLFTAASFILESGNVVRGLLIKEKNTSLFVLCFHHIVFDGWSLKILCDNLNKIYSGQSLCQAGFYYTDYANWQASPIARKMFADRLDYWRQYLSAPPRLDLPSDKGRPPCRTYNGESVTQKINQQTVDRLLEMTKSLKTTVFSILYSAFALLLHQYTGQSDIIVGCPNYNRPFSALNDIVGYFVSVLPVRSCFHAGLTLEQFILYHHENLLNVFNQAVPMEYLLEQLEFQQGGEANPVFQALFVYQLEENSLLDFDGMVSHTPHIYYLGSKLDLTFSLQKEKSGISVTVEFNTDLFNQNTIERLLENYIFLLTSFSGQLTAKTTEILSISQKEQALLRYFSAGKKRQLPEKNVCQFLKKATEKYPNNIAIHDDVGEKTYLELDQCSDDLASHLLSLGVKTQDRIVIFARRNVELIVAIIATLKAGCVFIPIAETCPSSRVDAIRKDSGAQLTLTTVELSKQLKRNKSELIFLDRLECLKKGYRWSEPVLPSSLAYIIYTSGSTGQPKGIMIEHKSVINMVLSEIERTEITSSSRTLSFASIAFDAFISELFTTLFSGAGFYITAKNNILPGRLLLKTLQAHKITRMTITPSALSNLIPTTLPHLSTLIVASEPLPQALVDRWAPRVDRLINAYGPTEACVCTTMNLCQKGKPPLIGKPINNFLTYVLDENLKQVPIGVIGELYIGGVGLARGYVNQKTLTEKPFIKNPFSYDTSSRLYRSGDLVRWHDNGELEYIGRKDRQIKLRGHRIEPTEVSSKILVYTDAIRQAYVCVKRVAQNDQRLIAYFSAEQPVDIVALKLFLKTHLPHYMIPQHFMQIETLPLTTNDKINEKKLPMPLLDGKNKKIIKPRTKTQKTMLAVWEAVFNQQNISIDDDFFDLGGHSILAVKLIDRLNEELNAKFKFNDLISAGTIETLSHLIDRKQSVTSSFISLQTQGDKTPLILIHPIGGTVFWYLNLAKYIKDRPIYAIQDPGINSEELTFDSLGEMAEHYYQLIKQHQIKPPYLLGGASSGSNIATEIAVLMRKNNEAVSAIVSLDGWLMYPKDLDDKKILGDILKKQLTTMIEKFDYHIVKSPEKWRALQLQRGELMLNYCPPTMIHSPVILLKAAELLSIFEVGDVSLNYWDQFCVNPVYAYAVPGSHETMHYEPHVQVVAATLKKALDDLEHQALSLRKSSGDADNQEALLSELQ
jgi:amino acid adenylation domain-containing protein